MVTAAKSSLENKHLRNGDYFEIIPSCSHSILWTIHYKEIGWSVVEVNVENERFADMC